MVDPVPTKKLASPIARRDWAYAGHVALCAVMIAGRMAESTPSLSAAQNGAYAGTPLVIALTMLSIWIGVASAVGVLALTVMVRDDAKLWILAVLMALSILWRRDIDVFDITYVALAAVLAAWWFNAGRARMQSAADAGGSPSRAAGRA
jgi:multisubunit Na+/H+ antiporter MnhC subunit